MLDIDILRQLTVVLIHMSAPTFNPMATAPAVPPRMADLPALSKISLTVGGSSVFASVGELILLYLVAVCCVVCVYGYC